jgi:hypothetical protein
MKWSKYSLLKTANKVAFEKVDETKDSDDNVLKKSHIVLSEKRFDIETGEALDNSKQEYSLSDLEDEKARYDSQIVNQQAESDGLAKAIEDFKKL